MAQGRPAAKVGLAGRAREERVPVVQSGRSVAGRRPYDAWLESAERRVRCESTSGDVDRQASLAMPLYAGAEDAGGGESHGSSGDGSGDGGGDDDGSGDGGDGNGTGDGGESGSGGGSGVDGVRRRSNLWDTAVRGSRGSDGVRSPTCGKHAPRRERKPLCPSRLASDQLWMSKLQAATTSAATADTRAPLVVERLIKWLYTAARAAKLLAMTASGRIASSSMRRCRVAIG